MSVYKDIHIILTLMCRLEKYFLPNFASDYQTFIEINDHFNVYFIHLSPCIKRMGNLYSTYLKKTHSIFRVKLRIEMRYRMRLNMRR